MEDFNVYVMIGILGSGKSTWIKNNIPDIPVVSRDLIRTHIGLCGEGEKCVSTKENEKLVTDIENNLIEKYCIDRQPFVIDDINIGSFRPKLIERLKNHGAHIIFVKVNTPLDICKQRRQGQIPSEAMDNINNRVIEPQEGEYDELINYNGYNDKIIKEGLFIKESCNISYKNMFHLNNYMNPLCNLQEGLIRTYPIKTAVKYIAQYYDLDENQYSILEGCNGIMCVKMAIPDIYL